MTASPFASSPLRYVPQTLLQSNGHYFVSLEHVMAFIESPLYITVRPNFSPTHTAQGLHQYSHNALSPSNNTFLSLSLSLYHSSFSEFSPFSDSFYLLASLTPFLSPVNLSSIVLMSVCGFSFSLFVSLFLFLVFNNLCLYRSEWIRFSF